MKRRFLALWVTLFSLAAIGLVVVQIVQTRRASEISDNLFNVSVNNAMENVINQFDRMKMDQYLSQSERNRLRQYRRIEDLNDRMLDIVRSHSDLFYDESRMHLDVALQDSAFILQGVRLAASDSSAVKRYNTLVNARKVLFDNASQNGAVAIARPAEILTSDNFNYFMLDSLIREELILNGVDISPNVGLYDNSNGAFLFISHEKAKEDLLQASYRYNFLPSGIASAEEYSILLYFPTSFLFNSDSHLFVWMSSFLIFIICVLFVVAIHIINSMRKLDEMKTEFTNNMTHEIKTPIATIALACEMLRDDTVTDNAETRRNFVNIISDENRRMRTLVETILQSAKMEKKNFSINCKELDIHRLVRSSADDFKLALASRQGSITLNLNAENATIYADELHMNNLVHNLIDNAIKYSPQTPTITISTAVKGDKFILSVSDQGLGISKEDQKHIFDKYYRVSTGDVHNVKGFGIGLSYVFQVVNLHHGSISVDSELGKGSTFSVTLPI